MSSLVKFALPESKTNHGLILILGIATMLSLLGKLTPEMVDVLKWTSVAFFGVRGASNISENMTGNTSAASKQ